MPNNKLEYLKRDWNSFINSCQATTIKGLLINPMLNFGFNKEIYKIFIESHNKHIPNIFKNKFKYLIKYEVEKTIYIQNYYYNQESKINIINKCAYCRL